MVNYPQLTFFSNSSPILEMLRQHVVWDYINTENSVVAVSRKEGNDDNICRTHGFQRKTFGYLKYLSYNL